jgi:trans-aconitate 2-methyltransferase
MNMPAYQWNASDYEKNSSQQQLWARELIEKLKLRGDETLLDVGCGDGKVSAEIATQLPRGAVTGVDISEAMIALAQQRYPPQDFHNLRFQVEDASNLPFNEQFSVVFSNATLHWLTDHRAALSGIARSLRLSGKILLQMGGHGNAVDIVATLDKLIISPRWSDYFTDFSFPYGFFGPEEYCDWLRGAGLVPTRVELIPKDMTHTGKAGLAGWFRTTWLPYTQRVPEPSRDAFIDEFISAYLAEHPLDKAGNSHVKMVRLEVEAVK